MPAIHGFDGSETMTSYDCRPSIRCVRPSPTIRRVRGSASARLFSASKNRDASTTPCEISSTVTSVERMRQRGPQRHAAAEAEDRGALRIRMQQQRHMREQALRQHVAGVRRVDLAVDRQGDGAGQAADRHGAGRALAIRQQLSGRQRRLEARARASPARTCTRRSRAARDPIAATRRSPPPPHRPAQSPPRGHLRQGYVPKAASPRDRPSTENRDRARSRRVRRRGGWCRAGPLAGTRKKPDSSDPRIAPIVLTA